MESDQRISYKIFMNSEAAVKREERKFGSPNPVLLRNAQGTPPSHKKRHMVISREPSVVS